MDGLNGGCISVKGKQRRGGCESSVVDHMDTCMFGLSGCCKPNLYKQSHFPVSITSFLSLLLKLPYSPLPLLLLLFSLPFSLSLCRSHNEPYLSLSPSLSHSLSHSLSLSVLSMKGLGELGPLPFPSSIPRSSSSSSPPPPTSWLALAAVSLEDGKEKEQEEEEREGRKWRWGHAVRRISPSPSPSLHPGRRWAL